MAMPTDVGAIDLMIGFPFADKKATTTTCGRGQGHRAKDGWRSRPGTCSRTSPTSSPRATTRSTVTLGEMDTYGVAVGPDRRAASNVASGRSRSTPTGSSVSIEVDPNDITGAVRKIREAHDEHGIKAVTTFPAGCIPQVPVSDRRYYPMYQTCIDLDIPIIVNAGIPGPRRAVACQHVEHFDQVCYDFPELRIVMRHGAEPWEELAVKLMLKWPGLYYMPTRVRPEVLPEGDHRLRQHPRRRQGHVRRATTRWG